MDTLFKELQARKVAAFKSRDTVTKGLIDTLIGEIQRDANYRPEIVDGKKSDPTDKIVLQVIRRLVKSLSMVDTESNKAETAILEEFLPSQMSEEEVGLVIDALISEGATNMGVIMKTFQTKYSGKADNKLVSTLIKTKLSEIAEG